MKSFDAILDETVATQVTKACVKTNSALIRFSCCALFENKLLVQPGQYFQVWREQDNSILPVIAFPASQVHDNKLLLDCVPAAWNPGEALRLRGPLGKGFAFNSNLTSLCFLTLSQDPLRLLPLINQAIHQNASVSLFMDTPKETQSYLLPPELEVQPLEALPDALAWAEYWFVDVSNKDLQKLPSLLGKPGKTMHGQILIRTAMPLEECFACAGIADCGVCAVDTKRGSRLACKDGPVFKLEEILYVV